MDEAVAHADGRPAASQRMVVRVLSAVFQGFGSISGPEMSQTGRTVPDMNEPPGRYTVTMTVGCDGGYPSDARPRSRPQPARRPGLDYLAAGFSIRLAGLGHPFADLGPPVLVRHVDLPPAVPPVPDRRGCIDQDAQIARVPPEHLSSSPVPHGQTGPEAGRRDAASGTILTAGLAVHGSRSERELGFQNLCAARCHRQSTLAHTRMSRRMRLLLTLCNMPLPGAAQVAPFGVVAGSSALLSRDVQMWEI